MKKQEAIYREILYQSIEKKEFNLTQSELSKKLGISLSNINLVVKKLALIGALKINPRNFHILNIKKILLLWASLRNIEKDIIYRARINLPVKEIERLMPNITFTAYTAYKYAFDDIPSDYSEIYVYCSEQELEEIKKRIAKLKTGENNPNFFVLKKDNLLKLYDKLPLSQIFVDLWNLKEWYAHEFLSSFEEKLNQGEDKA
jgi:hypothetical protein